MGLLWREIQGLRVPLADMRRDCDESRYPWLGKPALDLYLCPQHLTQRAIRSEYASL
jgi:hypothetical protein